MFLHEAKQVLRTLRPLVVPTTLKRSFHVLILAITPCRCSVRCIPTRSCIYYLTLIYWARGKQYTRNDCSWGKHLFCFQCSSRKTFRFEGNKTEFPEGAVIKCFVVKHKQNKPQLVKQTNLLQEWERRYKRTVVLVAFWVFIESFSTRSSPM